MDERSAKGARRLILVELNEINFDIARRYAATHPLPGINRLLQLANIHTSAEDHYEELEPWIQWPSAHCGMRAAEHKIFRLGDIVHTEVPQIFEQLEGRGLRVGAISAMNAANRLANPAYFIPDPWTRTRPDDSWWSRALTTSISQAVNDNAASALTLRSATHVALALIRFARPRHYSLYLRLALGSRGAPWRKALLLDLLLHDIHMRLFQAQRADFSTLFLNAGAHIQHHYFFNSSVLRGELGMRNPDWYVAANIDPIAEMLEIYDRVITDYLNLPGVEIVLATGLSQCPYTHVKYYYRLRDHAAFLRDIGISVREVQPRMTRDFLVHFDDVTAAAAGAQRLASITVDGQRLFGEIDNRGDSLFVTLTYPTEITANTCFEMDGRVAPLQRHVVFVAIKNGMHQGRGFAFFTPGISVFAPRDGDHVKELHGTMLRFFHGASPAAPRT
jgi:hypothetical protein